MLVEPYFVATEVEKVREAVIFDIFRASNIGADGADKPSEGLRRMREVGNEGELRGQLVEEVRVGTKKRG